MKKGNSMRKRTHYILLAGWLATLAGSGFAAGNDLLDSLLPQPQTCEPGAASFTISDQTKITVVSDGSAQGEFAGTRLAELLKEQHGLELDVVQKQADASFSIFFGNADVDGGEKISLEPVAGKEEGYVLTVGAKGAMVRANTAQGLFHGAMTLRQLVAGKSVTGCTIIDYPRYELRGIMVDAGRAPVRLAHIKRMVRICSAFKLNFLLYRESDNELNAVNYENNPLGSKNPEALTMAEVKEMGEYAALHGIQVIPEIEALGHAGARRMHYPDLVLATSGKSYGKGFGTHYTRAHLLPADERSFALLESVYSEWFAAMDCPYIHLGMDEINMPADQQAEHLEKLIPRILATAAKYNQKPKLIVWSDAPATPEQYKDIVIRSPWSYGNRALDGGKGKHLKHQGVEALLEPDCKEKVLMGAGSSSSHGPLSKCGYDKAFQNLAEWAMLGNDRENFMGMVACSWHGNMLDEWLPDFLAGADVSWNPPAQVPAFEPQMAVVQSKLSEFKDAVSPDESEMTPPAWHGMWIKGKEWDKLIAPLPEPKIRDKKGK
jgi:hypothetical protein